MKSLINPPNNRAFAIGLLALLISFFASHPAPRALAQSSSRPPRMSDMPGMPPSMPASSSASSSKPADAGGGPWVPSDRSTPGGDTNEIQLSFQGANIDMVVQWLAETTGKTVVKHPQVQCQLTITSSKKVSTREAINIVYRALALEGYSAVETSRSIMIVPQGKEPKMTPEVVSGSMTNLPEGRQLFTRVFTLKHISAADLKDKIAAALSDKSSIQLDESANQIVISDYNDNLRVVGELIDALDTDRPEQIAIRVISLKHMSATELAKELAPLYQKVNSKNARDTVDVTSDDRSNTLIVLAGEANFNALQKIVVMLDTDDAQDKTMETFILKNADAADVVKQIQDLGSDNNNSGMGGRFFFFGSGNPADKSKKVGVAADRRRNAVVVQAPPAQIEGIRKMIAELDEPITDNGLAPKIYHLKYASATDIEDVLNQLFLKKQQQRSYWDYYYGDDNQDSGSGQDAGRLYGKVRITSEPYSNTLIVTSNSKENLTVLEDVLNQLDQPSDAGESTIHLRLRYAKASDVANAINILFAKNGSPPLRPVTPQNQTTATGNQSQTGQQQNGSSQNNFDLVQEVKEQGYFPWLGGQPDNARGTDAKSSRPVSDLVGRVRAVADERSNGVLVSANVHFLPQVLKLVDELDAATDQVLVETRIVEVSTDLLDQMGVRWSPDGSSFTAKDFDNGIVLGNSTSYVKGFGGTTQGVTTSSNTSLASMITSMRSGTLNNSISMEFLVQFLHENVKGTVLAEPQLYIGDNETGRLFVGQQVPIPDNTQISSVGSQNTAIKYKDVGVVLEVTPHINSSGDVELKIHAESSTVESGQTVLGGAVFNSRAFKTDMTAKNGQTLVLGGIIQRQVNDTFRKTPILGDIPGLGWAFKKKDKETQEVELMVFLRPKVVRTQADAKDLLREIDRRAPLVKPWQDEVPPPPAPILKDNGKGK